MDHFEKHWFWEHVRDCFEGIPEPTHASHVVKANPKETSLGCGDGTHASLGLSKGTPK